MHENHALIVFCQCNGATEVCIFILLLFILLLLLLIC